MLCSLLRGEGEVSETVEEAEEDVATGEGRLPLLLGC